MFILPSVFTLKLSSIVVIGMNITFNSEKENPGRIKTSVYVSFDVRAVQSSLNNASPLADYNIYG